jgi:hypothetical protein
VLFDIRCLAEMTRGALAISETPVEREAVGITVGLSMGLVAVGARHGSAEIAIAPQVTLLIGERPDASVRKDGIIGEKGQAGAVVLRERFAGEVTRCEAILERVAAEAELNGFVLVEGRE